MPRGPARGANVRAPRTPIPGSARHGQHMRICDPRATERCSDPSSSRPCGAGGGIKVRVLCPAARTGKYAAAAEAEEGSASAITFVCSFGYRGRTGDSDLPACSRVRPSRLPTQLVT